MKISGFVDLQVNGLSGVDFSSSELSVHDLVCACRELRGEGTAAFLSTVITSSPEVYVRNLPIIARAMHKSEVEGIVLGIHLEGPFLLGIIYRSQCSKPL